MLVIVLNLTIRILVCDIHIDAQGKGEDQKGRGKAEEGMPANVGVLLPSGIFRPHLRLPVRFCLRLLVPAAKCPPYAPLWIPPV